VASDPRTRFSAAAGDYQRGRPTYPDALVDWILEAAGLQAPSRIADVGCGTGISTRLFAARGHEVIGIDPNEAMLARAQADGGARYVRGEAAATGLRDASVDLVTVAQAFHWFEIPVALEEFRRILRPGGSCAAFWNLRGNTPFLDAYDALLRAYSTEYHVLTSHEATLAALRVSPDVADLREAEFGHVQVLDHATLMNRVNSSSYVVHGVPDRAAFERALEELFARHEKDGCIDFVYRTVALVWRPARR
jgi:ubiquinone/menaquinone biosynthesis C-methylase UbiE